MGQRKEHLIASTAAALIADDVLAKLDIRSLFALPAADVLARAASNASMHVSSRIFRTKPFSSTNTTSAADPVVLQATIQGARKALAGLSVDALTHNAHHVATQACIRLLQGAPSNPLDYSSEGA